MSLQRACAIVESEPNKWYLCLAVREHGNLYDYDAFAVGSFKCEEDAIEYLRDNYSNPGGFNIWRASMGEVPNNVAALISKANKPTKGDTFSSFSWRY